MLTFAPMIDSETSRLLCRWYGLVIREEDHLFGWVSLLTFLHGGYGRVPLIFGRGWAVSGPRPLVDRFDPQVAPNRRLLLDGSEAAGVETDWSLYNGEFAVDVAVFSYFNLLPRRDLMEPVFAAPVPQGEARLTPSVYPLLRWLFDLLLQLKPARAEAAAQRIAEQFFAMDRRLADGRRFLCGGRLTLGDIAFAGASAPLLQPVGYGARMPVMAEMPQAIRDLANLARNTRVSAYVDRVYTAIQSSACETALVGAH